MSCVTTVAQTLEGFDPIEKATYIGNKGTFLLQLTGVLPQAEAAERIRQAGLDHDRRLGHSDRPPWVMRVIADPTSENSSFQ